MRRFIVPESRDDALRVARSHGSTVLIDLDGTLVRTGDRSASVAVRVQELLGGLRGDGVEVVIVTNRREEVPGLPVAVVANANKPWTSRSRLGSPSCVVGDQLVTDGALAFRLGVPFIKVPLGQDCRPWPSRLADRMLSVALARAGRR